MGGFLLICIGFIIGVGVSYKMNDPKLYFHLERCENIKRILLKKAQECNPGVIDPSELIPKP